MKDKPGSIVGGVLLIGGSCLGAGMLGLPILTGLAGFFPSIVMFLLAWAFMTLTALLMIEINSSFDTQVNIISMAGRSLGAIGRIASWVLYLFLFYSLLVAYIAGSGSLISLYVPSWVGSVFFTFVFGVIVYFGTRAVDHWNRGLMFGKILSYLGLVILGVQYVQPQMLMRTEPSYAILSLPVLIISFGFHNMIPTLTAYMKNDIPRVRATIIGGSLFALVIYLIWEIIVLGIVPLDGEWGLFSSWKSGREASESVAGILGVSWVSTFAQSLAFFALLTSFLAQTLGLVHFLADGLKVKSIKHENVPLCALALAPPLVLALIYPQIFLKALNFAGGICAVVLFGILPVIMVWLSRYVKQTKTPYRLFGGKPILAAVFFFALFVLFFQLSSMLGLQLIPKP